MRFIGMGRNASPDTDIIEWREHEWLILCTDGLTEPLYEEQMEGILNRYHDPAHACEALVDAATKAGTSDNITVLIAERE
jgi:protein phosphatase